MQMIEYLHFHVLPFTVVLTKADKLSKMKLKEHIRAIAADLYLGVGNLIATSSETGYGKTELLNKIHSVIQLQEAQETDETDVEDEMEEA